MLTLESNVKLHSCEKDTECPRLDDSTVWIRPIIARTASNQEVCEIGVGGGRGDLTQNSELELESDEVVQNLMASFLEKDPYVLAQINQTLMEGLFSGRKALFLDELVPGPEKEALSLNGLLSLLVSSAVQKSAMHQASTSSKDDPLPKIITFPYSRHSSYPEQRDLVKAFRPLDVYPCTVNKHNWHEGVSVRNLFGDLCSADFFRHDREMDEVLPDQTQVDSQNSWSTSDLHDTQEQNITCDKADPIPPDNVNSLVAGPLTADTEIGRTEEVLVTKSGKPIDTRSTSSSLDFTIRVLDGDGTELSRLSEPPSQPKPRPESQNRRRKAIFEADDCRSIKRPCIEREARNPSSDVDSPKSICGDSSDSDGNPHSEPEVVPEISYYDPEDDVHRCRSCGWEVWRPEGECLGCDEGKPSYYECTRYVVCDLEGDRSVRVRIGDCYPRILLTEDGPDVELLSAIREELTGCYLDGKSAYETDSSAEADEYEINSFIDDSPIEEEEEEGSSQSQRDYKQLYHQLLKSHQMLGNQYDALGICHHKLQRDCLGAESGNSVNPLLDVVHVEIIMKDPADSEVVPSPSEGQAPANSTWRLSLMLGTVHATDEDP